MKKQVLFMVTVPCSFVRASSDEQVGVPGSKQEIAKGNPAEKQRLIISPPDVMRDFLIKQEITDYNVLPYAQSKTFQMMTGSVLQKEEESKAKDPTNDSVLFMFSTEVEVSEHYVGHLNTLGVGAEDGFGSIKVVPLQFSREAMKSDKINKSNSGNGSIRSLRQRAGSQNQSIRDKIRQTIKSRIAVDHVISLVLSSAEFTFDYMMLVLIASTLAAIGLIVDSVVVIVASMLVSPLMGPILALTFGTTIRDSDMVIMGLKTEGIGLCMCVVVGFIGALCATPIVHDDSDYEFPTESMTSRGTLRAFYEGIFVAIPSGIGVCLAILGKNTSSLVGVAISASLLPPAVNCGLFLGYSCLAKSLDNADAAKITDYVEMGLWSFGLTIANIFCIWLSGIAMFRLKEVTPFREKTDFWKTHVPCVRTYNEIMEKGGESSKNVFNEIKETLPKDDHELIDEIKHTQDFMRMRGISNLVEPTSGKTDYGGVQHRRQTNVFLKPPTFNFSRNRRHSSLDIPSAESPRSLRANILREELESVKNKLKQDKPNDEKV